MEENVVNVSFEVALATARKQNVRIARAAWKGKNWVAVVNPENNTLLTEGFWNDHVRKVAESLGGRTIIKPFFILKTEDNHIQLGWSPTQKDMLSEDWYVVVD